jgi:ATP-dependent protease ClpP protease subunit
MTDPSKPGANRYWGDRTPPKSKAEFFNAVTSPSPSGGNVATIRLYGPIDSWGGWWGISTKDVGQVLDALGDDVTQIILRINSPGGEVFEGISILNMFRAHKARVIAVVDGLAGSIASCIAAGVDETVMSPGTSMVIHKPWGIEIGNADDFRKHAMILDSLEASLTEIYAAKAGEKDWSALLSEETWMTAAETVGMGLADRVAVVPDAGEAETVGDDQLILVIDDDEDTVRVTHLAAGMRPAAIVPAVGLRPVALKPPSSPEPVDLNQETEVAMSDTLKAGLLERLGITDAADLTDDAILASVDEVIEKATEPAPEASATPPEGTTLIDSGVLADLQAKAEQGAQALAAQSKARRDGIIAGALAEGRISPANKAAWESSLEKDEDGAKALLESLPKNAVPVDEIGGAGDPEASSEDALYDRIYGDKKKGA